MNKNAMKLISMLLVLLMLFTCLAACKKNEATDTDGTESQTGDVADGTAAQSGDTESLENGPETDDQGYIKDTLPESYDWEGADFDILQWKLGHDFVVGAEASASSINRVKFQSQKAVEERFKVKIKVHEEDDGWRNDTLISALEASVSVGSGTYDMVSHYTDSAGRAITNKLCMNLNALPYVDFEKPWWPQHLLESATIGEKMYYCGGDINGENLIRYMCTTYVNLDMYEEYHIEELVDGRTIYEVVEDGDWTIETFQTMALGTTGSDESIYGLTWRDGEYWDAFLYSGGFSLVKSENGVLTMNDDLQSDRMVTWVAECQKLLTQTHPDTKQDYGVAFKEGRSLFGGDEHLTYAEELVSDGTVNFSVLPMPKYDSDQEHYYTCEGYFSSLITVPSDVKDTDMAGMLVEGLASQNHRVVKDVVYYDIFQARYSAAEDAKGAKMFDILYASVVFDVGRVFNHNGFNSFIFRHVVGDSTASWTTAYQENIDQWINGINDLYVALG
ncbi:MAG: extracellular solute-binding protein [Ruminococcaceae bacterium]|nr:extracellular solute-binding protein [Oscillospiraceae bacterium]